MSSDQGFRIIRFGDVPWEPRTEDEWPCLVKRHVIDRERDTIVRIVWYAREAVEPRHVHSGTHAAIVLLGQALVDGKSLGPWDAVFGPANVPHGPLHYPFGCMLWVLINGGGLHQRVGQEATAAEPTGVPPRMVLEREHPWSSPGGEYEGLDCERKLLVEDAGRGYTASLMRWARGAVEPRRTLPGTRAALVLTGRPLVGGAQLAPWDVLYMPGGVPFGPIEYPEGCTLALSVRAGW